MEICFEVKEVLDLNLHLSFDLYEHVLATSLEKRKTNFPRLHSWSSLRCRYRFSNILLHHQNVLPRIPEISVRWFLLKSVLKEMWAQGWGPFYWDINHQCNPRTTLQSTFDFTEIMKEWKWMQVTVCHYVRFISQLS